jgi:hypothetical protein
VGAEDRFSYEEFGPAFIRHAVSNERIVGAIGGVASAPIRFGPQSMGPANAAEVRAEGTVRDIRVTDRQEEPVLALRVDLAVDLDLRVTVAGAKHRFKGDIGVPLAITVLTAAPLSLVIDIAPVRAGDVDLDLRASGLRAKVIQKIGDVDNELRRQVAHVVNERVESADAARLRTIDILSLIDDAWQP